MNVGYTPERALDLASRLRRTSAELEAAAAVVECSRRVASHPGDVERARLVDALLEYDRSREIAGERRDTGRLRGPVAVEGAAPPPRTARRTRNALQPTHSI